MKLALFNLREDERPFVDSWLKEHPEVEIDRRRTSSRNKTPIRRETRSSNVPK